MLAKEYFGFLVYLAPFVFIGFIGSMFLESSIFTTLLPSASALNQEDVKFYLHIIITSTVSIIALTLFANFAANDRGHEKVQKLGVFGLFVCKGLLVIGMVTGLFFYFCN